MLGFQRRRLVGPRSVRPLCPDVQPSDGDVNGAGLRNGTSRGHGGIGWRSREAHMLAGVLGRRHDLPAEAGECAGGLAVGQIIFVFAQQLIELGTLLR